jgi:hypothetical protein
MLFSEKTAQSKKSPNTRKFAKSGHPVQGSVAPLHACFSTGSSSFRHHYICIIIYVPTLS